MAPTAIHMTSASTPTSSAWSIAVWLRPWRIFAAAAKWAKPGTMMGAVLNLRPDLFRAALVGVPFVDVMNTMLDESLPLTVSEFEEWGNPKQKSAFDYMMTYSPYDNVEAKNYADMLVKTS